MKKIIILISILLVIAICGSFVYFVVPNMNTDTEYSNNENNVDKNNSNESSNGNSSNQGNVVKDENVEVVTSMVANQVVNGNLSTVNLSANNNKFTVADLKKQFALAGVDDSNKYMFKPFYNVEQTTEFTFHFNSKVDPVKAITVHTDEKCDYLSLVWQINDAYWTENGIDVIVKPSTNTAVLYTQGRNAAEKGVWGYAPMYYICVRYDLDSKEVKKLDKPIIIPFTVKNQISTPTVYASIDEKGTFSVKWNKVEGATSYKVYSGYGTRTSSLSAAETGYQDTPKLITTVDASKMEFNPGYLLTQEKTILGGKGYTDNTVRENEKEYNIELVNRQNENIYGLYAFYITAVDANGNESNFGVPVMLNKYKSSLPWRVDVSDLNRYTELTEFPNTVSVESVDMKTSVQYPINFYKIENPGEYDSYCDYRYEIVGTQITGIVSLKSETREFPQQHLSDYKPQASLMPQNTMDMIPQVNIDTFADEDYSNSKVDLKGRANYPESAKVQLDAGSMYMLVDRDIARRSIGKTDTNVTDPREEFDSFIADGDPEYIVRREGTTLIVEKVDKNNKAEDNKKPIEEDKKPIEEDKKPIEEDKKPVEEETKPAKEIDNSNYVEEQRKSTEKQVEEADKEEVKGTKYPVFADNAAQMYLALAMINNKEVISLKAFPEYQNMANLSDDLLYLWYQNPYIMTVDLETAKYNPETQELFLKYGVPAATAKQYQEAVYIKSKEVISKIIKPGMTDSEKVVAIYDYLEKNAEYNHEAYEYVMAGGEDLYYRYPNSWNTYGILCEGLGVCQSYAYAFDLLAYLADVDSVMAIGRMGNVGHAWNAVKLSGKWYMVDTTNNVSSLGFSHWICNASSDFIQNVAFVLDDRFVDGTDYSEFLNPDNTKDWYYENGLMVENGAEFAKAFEKHFKASNRIVAKCSVKTQTEAEAFINEFANQLVKDGYTSDDLKDWKYGFTGSCIVFMK